LPVLRECFQDMPPHLRRRIAGGRVPEWTLERPGRLADHLAHRAILSGEGLNGIQQAAGAVAGTPLMDAVWARILAPAAAPWFVAHPLDELKVYLQSNRESVRIGQVGNLLLGSLIGAGLRPTDAQGTRPLALLC